MTEFEVKRTFSRFAPRFVPHSRLRDAITSARRTPEALAIAPLINEARVDASDAEAIAAIAGGLVRRLRARGPASGLDALVKEYSLSTQEGVALMCLAEALLRIPDDATRDALIRDKISLGNWQSHLGGGRGLFVNAATWGLLFSSRIVGGARENALESSLEGLVRRAGEPVIRSGVEFAMKMMGNQFVIGETIGDALDRARKQEHRGFTYSYDMLGEAAMTMCDADRYFAAYERAIHAIGQAAAKRGICDGPGISIKLSALHPRYSRSQLDRVMGELLPRVRSLALAAKQYDIGFNIDAEEADRLEISLDVFEALRMDPRFDGWNGLGFVVQAFGKRCPFVIDWLIDVAKRSGHRVMVRLVKGAYWDSEIKRTQVEGLSDFPVFTRKAHTDVSYIACARRLLAARQHVFPQFATHNAQTIATILHLAGDRFAKGDYEFQCLHGMGEALYAGIVGSSTFDRPCRIYAPVGTHDTLLAYLVRRLLENGANSSFVNRIWDADVSVDELVADPVQEALAIDPPGSAHPLIKLPADMYPDRANSRGLDLSDDNTLIKLTAHLQASASATWTAEPMIPGYVPKSRAQAVHNPADRRDIVGTVKEASPAGAHLAAANAARAFADWAGVCVADRARCLVRAAEILESRTEVLLGLIMREAGKSAPNAIAEVREAVDFLRYYAVEACKGLEHSKPVGPIVSISPWNFPLAIFTGQIAAALVAGNTVIAKPAEETPLIAAQAVAILHEAGVPPEVLQLVTGAGAVGAELVGARETCGVVFTGSTEVAKLIQRQLADRTLEDGSPLPLIAETGGQNAMVVDSSALPEQVVRDVIASAFDSAGQRCSALRILCVQEDIADGLLEMLSGAVGELRVGSTDELRTDIGPVISSTARSTIIAHIESMRSAAYRVEQVPLDAATQQGSFVAPTLIEIDDIAQLDREVFGPVLHVLRYRRDELGRVIEQVNATGYGLTFGIHSRVEETVDEVIARVGAGNVYVNRNTIGAIVGVQPFGGRGLSGTGPKAGGPLYLSRLTRSAPPNSVFLYDEVGKIQSGHTLGLPGPVGERNLYSLGPRGRVLLLPETTDGLRAQLQIVAETGNRPVLPDNACVHKLAARLEPEETAPIIWSENWSGDSELAQVLVERGRQEISPILKAIAGWEGPIPIVQLGKHRCDYRSDWLVEEVSISIDTTAAGGNASLMSVA